MKEFVASLNTFHNIQFTVELEINGCLPFLDIVIYRKEGGSLWLGVYRKLAHTILYLNNLSHHDPAQKHSVLQTLVRRARVIVDQDHLDQEMGLLKMVFQLKEKWKRKEEEVIRDMAVLPYCCSASSCIEWLL